MSTRHFVTFYFPGLFVDEETTREIAQRTEIGDVPPGAFGYQEWSRSEEEIDGETLRGEAKNRGPLVIYGKVYGLSDVEQLRPREKYRILISNMKGNGFDRVVRTVRGNWKPITSDVQVIDQSEVR